MSGIKIWSILILFALVGMVQAETTYPFTSANAVSFCTPPVNATVVLSAPDGVEYCENSTSLTPVYLKLNAPMSVAGFNLTMRTTASKPVLIRVSTDPLCFQGGPVHGFFTANWSDYATFMPIADGVSHSNVVKNGTVNILCAGFVPTVTVPPVFDLYYTDAVGVIQPPSGGGGSGCGFRSCLMMEPAEQLPFGGMWTALVVVIAVIGIGIGYFVVKGALTFPAGRSSKKKRKN